jgi:hypothetical protein
MTGDIHPPTHLSIHPPSHPPSSIHRCIHPRIPPPHSPIQPPIHPPSSTHPSTHPPNHPTHRPTHQHTHPPTHPPTNPSTYTPLTLVLSLRCSPFASASFAVRANQHFKGTINIYECESPCARATCSKLMQILSGASLFPQYIFFIQFLFEN